MSIVNPKTGRSIKIGGPTYELLMRSKKWAPLVKKARKIPAAKKATKNKYRLKKSEFCGPKGGARQYTYPVNTPGRARAALAYARYAPNPKGLKACVKKVAKKKGWVDPKTGKIKQK